MYRQPEAGGLGLFNVKIRSMAMLIHTFLSQAISPLFPANMYHNTLYRWHVLEQRDLPNPGCPPYYSSAFFSLIKDVHENTPLNVTWITVKEWYRLLLEKGVTHTSDDPSAPALLIASKVELAHPEIAADSYLLARKFGLAPEQKSFLFKMVQSLLPNKERLARIGKVPSPACSFCQAQEDTTLHLLSCTQGSEVTALLLRCLADHVPNLTHQNLVILNISLTESMELPVTWLLSTCLMMVWEDRAAGRTARLTNCQAKLQARLIVLKHTRWKNYSLHNCAVLLEEMMNLHFS